MAVHAPPRSRARDEHEDLHEDLHESRTARPSPQAPDGLRARLFRLEQRAAPYLFVSPFFLLLIVFGSSR